MIDLLHLEGDGLPGSSPCGRIAMTVALPVMPAGVEVTPDMVQWPKVKAGDLVACGSCGRYAGDCLESTCARPHRCVPIPRPGGRMRCRAGCDPA